MRNFIFVVIILILAGETYAAENAPKTAPLAPPNIETVSPEALFDQIRGFLTIPAPNLNITIPTLKTPSFDASGIQNLRNQIRDIAGVDIFQFLRFLLNIFSAVIHYLLDLLPRTAG